MLEFLRRHQRYFFAIITFVIVISFSFFGTYSALPSSSQHEQPAFKAVDGNQVKRIDVEQMAQFIGTDSEDKTLFGGIWGPNFLNDGVIRRDLLQTGIAEILAERFQNEFSTDLQERLQQEKRYQFYTHPSARFLSPEVAWGYFAPEINAQLAVLKEAANGGDKEAFQARVKLFLAERQFPAPLLRQVLKAQERQYSWIEHDPMLDRADLSLFGHHTLEDWFGPRFTRLAAQFIINSAKVAEQRGYTISDAEVLADLNRNAALSFQQQKNNPNLGVATQKEYFLEQLRRLNLDQSKAIKIWKQVMLFRRLFQDMGSSVLVDNSLFDSINSYAKETVEGSIYRLPESLRLKNFEDLQLLETYLQAVSARSDSKDNLQQLPQHYKSVEEVSKQTPELVQKSYQIEMASVEQKRLQARVSVKEMWDWEVADQNWQTLKENFPQLGLKPAETRQQRLEALEALDGLARSEADQMARKAIVSNHPEWAKQALDREETQPLTLYLSLKGGQTPLKGIQDLQAFQKLLDEAPISQIDEDSRETSKELEAFSPDGQMFYRIYVTKRDPKEQLMSFATAKENGVLNTLLEKQLQPHYEKLRSQNPERFKAGESGWKPLKEVQDLVAESYFSDLIQAVEKSAPKQAIASSENWTGQQAAAWRFYPYIQMAYEAIKQNPENEGQWVVACGETDSDEDDENTRHNAAHSLVDQWKLEKCFYSSNRGSEQATFAGLNLFDLPTNSWTKIATPINGDLAFIYIHNRGNSANEAVVNSQVLKAQKLLGDEAERMLARQLINLYVDKGSISLEYLNTPMIEEEETPAIPSPRRRGML